MNNTQDRHATAIARLIRDGHAATEDEAVDLLARLILRGYSANQVAVSMTASWLADAVAVVKKGGSR